MDSVKETRMSENLFEWLRKRMAELEDTYLLVGRDLVRIGELKDPRRQYYILLGELRRWRSEHPEYFRAGKGETGDQAD